MVDGFGLLYELLVSEYADKGKNILDFIAANCFSVYWK